MARRVYASGKLAVVMGYLETLRRFGTPSGGTILIEDGDNALNDALAATPDSTSTALACTAGCERGNAECVRACHCWSGE